jgi:hypothetical protein
MSVSKLLNKIEEPTILCDHEIDLQPKVAIAAVVPVWDSAWISRLMYF